MMQKFYHKTDREFVVTSFFLLTCFFLYFLLPVKGLFEGITYTLGFLILLPFLYKYYVLKENKRIIFTFNQEEVGKYTLFVVASFVLTTPIVAAHIYFPYAQQYITDLNDIFLSFKGFVFYELFFVAPILFMTTLFSVEHTKLLYLDRRYHLILSTLLIIILTLTSLLLPITALPIILIPTIAYLYLKIDNIAILSLTLFMILVIFDTILIKSYL